MKPSTFMGKVSSDTARAPAADVMRFENLLHMSVLWTLAVTLSYLQLIYQKVCRSSISFPRDPDVASHKSVACIVTGGSSGIGKATAEALALHGYHVILAGRSITRLLEVVDELKNKNYNVSLEALELDLCSVSSILAFREAVVMSLEATHGTRVLQLLVNNAGILAGSQRWTSNGFDRMIASNYLGPYLLTQQLLPILQKGSPSARIVNVVSFTHHCVKSATVNEKWLAQGFMENPSTNGYKIAQIYETSKFCSLLFAYELHHRLHVSPAGSPPISVMAADPGIVQTNILHELPGWLVSVAFFGLKCLRLLQTPQCGAKAVIDAALAPKGLSGKYFFGGNGRTVKSSSLSYDSNMAKQLWEVSNSLCHGAILQYWKENH